jgi:Protein of unknown function (DUF4240)
VSQRPRHGYAADLPHGLPGGGQGTTPGSSRRPDIKRRDAPRPAQIHQVRAGLRVEGRNDTGSSRTPFRHARRTRPIWQYWHVPALSGPLPALPGTTRIRLPSATPPCCDRTEAKVSHLHSNNSASRRNLEDVKKVVTRTALGSCAVPLDALHGRDQVRLGNGAGLGPTVLQTITARECVGLLTSIVAMSLMRQRSIDPMYIPRLRHHPSSARTSGRTSAETDRLSPVDTRRFWHLIDDARGQVADLAAAEAVAAQAAILLAVLPHEEIVSAERVLSGLMAESYRTSLWAAAYVINGGCSDDGFDYFRGWLIVQGREVFDQAVANLTRSLTWWSFAPRWHAGRSWSASQRYTFAKRHIGQQPARNFQPTRTRRGLASQLADGTSTLMTSPT